MEVARTASDAGVVRRVCTLFMIADPLRPHKMLRSPEALIFWPKVVCMYLLIHKQTLCLSSLVNRWNSRRFRLPHGLVGTCCLSEHDYMSFRTKKNFNYEIKRIPVDTLTWTLNMTGDSKFSDCVRAAQHARVFHFACSKRHQQRQLPGPYCRLFSSQSGPFIHHSSVHTDDTILQSSNSVTCD